jgi:hypothetical protein
MILEPRWEAKNFVYLIGSKEFFWGECMSREWGPTGVSDFQPVVIDVNEKKNITYQLNCLEVEVGADNLDLFFDDISMAAGFFVSGKNLSLASRPAIVRENLKLAKEAAFQLNDRLNCLDGNSRQLISESLGKSFVELQDVHLREIISALCDASHEADEYPTKGRLKEHHRLYFAIDVAHAIKEHLGQKPTSTKDGLFESILIILLTYLTNTEVTSVHDLVRRALKSQKIQNRGLTEYVLHKSD